ncbi:restriction endonuclease subunit S, partial [Enterococcus faecalis]|nr:restriction endonuclease subunit S [Enterococcus faecalis]
MKKLNTPNIRFEKFEDEWEERVFTDILVRKNSTSDSNELPRVEFEDIISGEGRLNKDVSQKLDNRKGITFKKGNILFGKLRPYLKNWLYTDFEGIAIGDFWVFQTKSSDSKFAYALIQAPKYQRVANDTSGTKMPRSDWKTVSETDFTIPSSLPEQSAIGTLFQTLDGLLSAYKDNLVNYQAFKATMLSKMFPKAGQIMPEIRLDGFDGEWGLDIFANYLSESRIPGNTGANSKKLTVKLWGKGVIA